MTALNARTRIVLLAVQYHGPLTDHRLARLVAPVMDPGEARRRRQNLRRLGLVIDTGRHVRDPQTKRQRTLWSLRT